MSQDPTAAPTEQQYIDRILRARVYDAAIESPLDPAPRLSARLGNDVLLKREDLQPVFSFKIRGACNKLGVMSDAALGAGVICSSAGNHAQGLAFAAKQRGVRAVVVMPLATPTIKLEAVEALGAEIVLHGADYDEAGEHARALAERQGLRFVHPFADPDVIAGQGTIGVELTRQWPRVPHAVFVPVGGGGLVSGIGVYIKHLYPEVRIVGVEPHEAASMHAALGHGGPVSLPEVGNFADGVAVRRVSDETYRLAAGVIDEIVLVSTDEICASIKDVFEDSRVIVEPAGALAVAGLKQYLEARDLEGETLVAINSGANMNFDRLRHVGERAEIGEEREALLAVEIPERVGAFLRFCESIGNRNITEFNYRYSAGDVARIFVGVSLRGRRAEAAALIAELSAAGYPVLDLSDNEMAKIHVRHMVGGRVPALRDESIFRFEFPERPGALLAFLRAIGDRWNISLFHYRNHGSDYGRVLAGVQVPGAQQAEFEAHLKTLGYRYWPETDNPAFRLFLGAEPG